MKKRFSTALDIISLATVHNENHRHSGKWFANCYNLLTGLANSILAMEKGIDVLACQ